jgi:hypothetical protein
MKILGAVADVTARWKARRLESGDMNPELAAIAARQYGLFTHQQAMSVGMTNDMIRSRVDLGLWQRVERGLYFIHGTPPSWRRDLLAAVLAAGELAVASHAAAAALWRLPGFGEGPIHVSTPYGCDHKFTLGRLHASCLLPRTHVTTIDEIPVTVPARMLFDVAAVVSVKKLERAANNALAMHLVTVPTLRRTLEVMAKRGRPGTRAFRALVDTLGSMGGHPESGLEADLIEIVLEAGFPMPELQVDMSDDQGFIARVDALWRPQRVVGEADSDRFHTAPLDVAADKRRDERLSALGYTVVRCKEAAIRRRSPSIVTHLRAALYPAAA